LLSLAGICHGKNATLVLVKDAVNQGVGASESKWILHLEGGGWCGDEGDCLNRSRTALGSSTFWPPAEEFHGFLSDNATVNPDFHDWNMVFLMYCDGGSFAGDRLDPVDVLGNKIYMRGKLVLNALIDNLLSNGLNKATEVILTGCSAGGLATYLHADHVSAYLPKNIKFRAFADAGYFLDIPDIHGSMSFRMGMIYGLYLHNATDGLDPHCLQSYDCTDEWRCFFAPYLFPFIKTPMFIANSLYDTAQLAGILRLGCLPPNCPEDKMKFFDNFRTQFLHQLTPALDSETTGIFADSCLVHCQTLTDDTWTQFLVGGQSMRDTFSDWYYGRGSGRSREVDCPFPCNPTCPVSRDSQTDSPYTI
jgi:hypothetical protein